MSKELYYNDIKLTITNDIIISPGKVKYPLYKVEMMDKNGFITTVYESSLNDAIEYAKYYFDNTEKRKKSYDSIGSMIEIDKKEGRNFPLD